MRRFSAPVREGLRGSERGPSKSPVGEPVRRDTPEARFELPGQDSNLDKQNQKRFRRPVLPRALQRKVAIFNGLLPVASLAAEGRSPAIGP